MVQWPDSMYTLYLISVWLHVLASMVWIGGMVFLALVLVPYARLPEQREQAMGMIRWTGVRFRSVGWICIAVLAATGLFNISYRGYQWTDLAGEFWKSVFGRTLAIKLGLVGIVLLISLVHDFVIGPRAGLAARTHPGSVEARRLRRQASWLGRLNLLLTLIILALAVTLVRGWP